MLGPTTTAGEDETSEGNPENSTRDAVDIAPSVPAPENEAAAEPTTTEPTMKANSYYSHLHKLMLFQKKAIRIISNADFLAHSSKLFFKPQIAQT